MADDLQPPDGSPEPETEIDSVMAEDAVAPQDVASPGLFVEQSTEPPTPAAETPMTGHALNQALLHFQADAAQRYLERNPAKNAAIQAQQAGDAADETPAGITDDEAPGFQQSEPFENDETAKNFAKIREKFLKRQKAGKITLEREIKFKRMANDEMARQNKLKQDAEYDRAADESEEATNELFVGESEVPDLPSDSEDKVGKGKKKPRKRKAAAENDHAECPSKRTKKLSAKRQVAGQIYSEADLNEVISKSKKAKKEPKAKAKAASKKKAPAGPSMTNTSNLRGTNIFRDAAENADLPDQPTFENATRRNDALAQMLSSVPTEAQQIAKYDKKFLDNAIKDFTGTGAVKPAPDGNWSVRGMKTTLKHYQVLGTAFMRRRENSSEQPRGGIMADGMGLGKTLQTLANIVNGRPPGKKKALRTTLIVASPALVNQWFAEIQRHCMRRSEHKEAGLGGVYQHRAGHRLDSNMDEEALANADIILTTYGEVNRSYPNAKVPAELSSAKEKDEWWKVHYEENKGILHQMKFLRVVLDEAQAIKNHRSLSAMACRALNARHYWALTGTPIYNSISEFYSLFKFLREPHTGSYKIFKANFCDPDDPDGIEKLNVFLRKIMVRRTWKDTLFGAKLLSLPTPTQSIVKLEFTEIERQVYEIVKNRMINRINMMAKQEGQNGLQKKFSSIWTMILRLRQLCGHILLIQGTILDILEREDFEKLNRLASRVELSPDDEGAALMVHLKRSLSARNRTTTIDSATGNAISETQIIATGTVDVGDFDADVGRGHGLSFRFQRYLKQLAKSDKWSEVTDRSCCVGCRQKPVEPWIAECWHLYCLSCLTDMQHLAARRGLDSMRCVECGENYSNAQPCEGLETLGEEISSRGTNSPTDTQVTTVTGKKKKETVEEDWINLPGEILPSAKTRAVKAQILDWLEEDPDAKIIVYTQFLPMVKILEKVCKSERWDYCKYTGNMSQDNRNKNIEDFGDIPQKKILLASLRAGGLGLNLTMASRVLLLDPWFNSAVEQQAFARVHRIGQEKETQLTRLCVTNTIDSAIEAIKKRKDKDIEAVMNDSKRGEVLDVKDLMRLFGPVKEGEDGKPFIFATRGDEYDEEEEHLRFAREDSQDEEGHMGNEE